MLHDMQKDNDFRKMVMCYINPQVKTQSNQIFDKERIWNQICHLICRGPDLFFNFLIQVHQNLILKHPIIHFDYIFEWW